jgi:hypothetical protein
MPRRALAVFFERLVLATLPLTVPACGDPARPPVAADMAVMNSSTDMAAPVTPSEVDLAMSLGPDLSTAKPLDGVDGGDVDGGGDPTPVNPCIGLAPGADPAPVSVPFPPEDVPPGGLVAVCHSGLFCQLYCPTYYQFTCCGPTAGPGGASDPRISCQADCNGPNAPGGGRRPAGLEAPTPSEGCATGRWLAHVAHLEAASVHAFRVMARELSRHGAPPRSAARARQALRDEVRHARIMRRLATLHGATVAPVRVTPPTERTLEAMALENAVEGCVRETFAALLALWQSRTASDPGVRAAMASIAPDEIRHAELSWQVDAWLARRLDAEARARVTAARQRAVDELAAEQAHEPAAALAAQLGLPTAAQAQELLAATASDLWSAAA